MKKNVAGQKIGVQMVSATDGSAFTGTVTVYITGDAGTQAIGSVSSGACTHEGSGYHTYAPSQAESNYDLIAFTFTGTGAIPVTIQVYTSFPQTGDSYGRLGAPAGASLSADIAATPAAVQAAFTDHSGTAQAGAAGTITLASGAVATDDYYNGAVVKIQSGSGAGQSRQITDYVGSTRVATVDSNWVTNPDNTSVVIVIGRIV